MKADIKPFTSAQKESKKLSGTGKCMKCKTFNVVKISTLAFWVMAQ